MIEEENMHGRGVLRKKNLVMQNLFRYLTKKMQIPIHPPAGRAGVRDDKLLKLLPLNNCNVQIQKVFKRVIIE